MSTDKKTVFDLIDNIQQKQIELNNKKLNIISDLIDEYGSVTEDTIRLILDNIGEDVFINKVKDTVSGKYNITKENNILILVSKECNQNNVKDFKIRIDIYNLEQLYKTHIYLNEKDTAKISIESILKYLTIINRIKFQIEETNSILKKANMGTSIKDIIKDIKDLNINNSKNSEDKKFYRFLYSSF